MSGLSVYDYNELVGYLKDLRLDEKEIKMVSNLVDGLLSKRFYHNTVNVSQDIEVFLDEDLEYDGFVAAEATPINLLETILLYYDSSKL